MCQAHYCLRPDDTRPLRSEVSAFIRWLEAQDLLETTSSRRDILHGGKSPLGVYPHPDQRE